MHLRRTTALSAASLLLAAPMLTSCGFDYATDRPYTPAAGTNDREGSVDVLGAVIVSGEKDSGTFIAALSNNDQEQGVAFEALSGAGDAGIQAESFSPMPITPGGLLNLSQKGGVPVTGSFGAGEVVPLSIGLDNGERVTLDVPVVENSGYFAGYDATASDRESASEAEGGSTTLNDVASSGSQGSQSTPSASPSE